MKTILNIIFFVLYLVLSLLPGIGSIVMIPLIIKYLPNLDAYQYVGVITILYAIQSLIFYLIYKMI